MLDLTDHHTDLAAQFTPAGTSLTGSRTYGPWGAVTASGGTLTGALGYQSQYTSPATGQVNMGARWYNPANGSFGNKDTAANKPVPDSASASPFGYAADNPLNGTDPTGHMAYLDIGGTTRSPQPKAIAAAKKAYQAQAKATAHKAAVKKAAAKVPTLLRREQRGGHGRHLPAGRLQRRRRPGHQRHPQGGLNYSTASQAMGIVKGQYNAVQDAANKRDAAAAKQRLAAQQAATTTTALAGCGLAAWKQGCAYGKYQDPGHASGTGGDFAAGVGSFFAGGLDMLCMVNPACQAAQMLGLPSASQLYKKQVIDRYHINQGSEMYFDGQFVPNLAMSFIPVGALGAAGDAAANSARALSDAASEAGANSKLLWAHWNDYPKVEVDGQEYAQIGDRLWSRHAVDRMQPSGMRYSPQPGPDEGGSTGGMPQIFQVGGSYDYGRSVSPNFVEDVIRSTTGDPQKNGNYLYDGGGLQVILSPEGRVVTVMTN